MLSRFLLGHFWLLVAFLTVLGRDRNPRSAHGYAVFGFGDIEPVVYFIMLAVAVVTRVVCLIASREPEDRPPGVG